MESRAYSTLEIKAFDEDQWVIEGIASTPTPDRYGDIVDPMGAKFALPMPLLWQHDSRKPVGEVTFAKPMAKGIPFKAKIHKASEFTSTVLQERALEAWESVKTRLVKAVSIGFTSIEHAFLKEGGIHFLEWEWLELSLVTIPANADATIQTIKSIDAAYRGATPPGAPGFHKSVSIHPKPTGAITMARKSIGEMVASLEATIEVKRNRQLDLSSKAAEEGRTKNESEQEEFNTLHGDIESLENELSDWRKMEKQAATARPVSTEANVEVASRSRGTTTEFVRTHVRREPGIGMARVVKALWQSRQAMQPIEQVARSLFPDDHAVIKAAVAAASTGGDTWGHQLVGDETGVFADFLEFLRPMTILGKFGTDGIPDLQRVPFRTPLIVQTSGGSDDEGYWVGEGQPKALDSFAFDRSTLDPLKVAKIAVATKEQLRSSSPASEGIIRNSLANSLTAITDITFIRIGNTGTSGIKPASITSAAPQYTSSGDDLEDIRVDVRSVFQGFINANNTPVNGVWIMSSATALALSMVTNDLNQLAYPNISMRGGTFAGLPVITSEHVGNIVVLVNASDIYYGDEGGISIDMSTEASLEMKNPSGSGAGAPTNNVISPTATSLVSLWQTNSVGFLAERTINWKLARASAVQVLIDVSWGGAVTEAES